MQVTVTHNVTFLFSSLKVVWKKTVFSDKIDTLYKQSFYPRVRLYISKIKLINSNFIILIKMYTYDCGTQPIANPTRPLKNSNQRKFGAIELSSP